MREEFWILVAIILALFTPLFTMIPIVAGLAFIFLLLKGIFKR